MNSLKFTLSSEQPKTKGRDKVEANDSLLKGVNRSKAKEVWALDVDSDRVTEDSLNTDGLLRVLNEQLESAYKKDSNCMSEVHKSQYKITFQRIIQEFQDAAGGSKSELAYLMVMEDKLTDIFEFAKEDYKKFLDIFNQMLEAKIIKMRKKQKKAELSNFDHIVNCNFKKKNEEKAYLIVEQIKPNRKSKEKEQQSSKSPRKASNSNDNKLNRLFSKDKNTLKQKQIKESTRKGEDDNVFSATTNPKQDESVSFSTVLSNNVTVKSRKRKNSAEGKKQKAKKAQDKGGDNEEGDEAFMFFRPKNKKKA